MKIRLVVTAGILLICFANAFAQKSEPLRISFAKGKTSATVTEKLSNDQEMDFIFGARAGQKISLKVISKPKGNLFDFILKGDGFELEFENKGYRELEFTAPETGDYLLFVRKLRSEKVKSARFYLTLTIK